MGRNLNLIYSGKQNYARHDYFRQSVCRARAGTFYLAKAHNNLILGAMTDAKIESNDGWNSYYSG